MEPLTEAEIEKIKIIAEKRYLQLREAHEVSFRVIKSYRSEPMTPAKLAECEKIEEQMCLCYVTAALYKKLAGDQIPYEKTNSQAFIQVIRAIINSEGKKNCPS